MTHTAQTWEKTVKENKYSSKRCGVFNTLVFELLVTKHGMEFTGNSRRPIVLYFIMR